MSTSTMTMPVQQIFRSPSISSESQYCTTEEIVNMRSKQNQTKKGLEHITEKYDSVGKFGPRQSKEINGENVPEKEKPEISSPTTVNTGKQRGPSICNFAEGVTEQDLLQVDMFYRSHKTEVHVCQCLANLYFGKVMGDQNQWKFAMTGIPLLVLDSGDHHRKRKLQIVLSEKGTGFVLWKDNIDHLTAYKSPHPNFHTMTLSSDHTRLAGLSFDDATSAADFSATIYKLTSNPDDDLLSLSKNKKKIKKRKSDKKKEKYNPPKKTEISQPCCFVHVTKLERDALDLSQPERSLISDPIGFENLTAPVTITATSDRDGSEISSLLGSKLTLNSEETSSCVSGENISSNTSNS